MDTELLDKILDAARHAATGSEAMRIEDLQRDLAPLAAILDGPDCDDLRDVAAYVTDFKALAAHIAVQPFDVLSENHDEILCEIEPGFFEEWLGELERLAR